MPFKRGGEKTPLLTATLNESSTVLHIKFASCEMNET